MVSRKQCSGQSSGLFVGIAADGRESGDFGLENRGADRSNRPYTGGYPRYKEICDKEMADGFPSFILTK